MSVLERISSGIVRYSRVVIVVLLLSTIVIGAGAPAVTRSTSIESFQSGTSEAAHAQEYITDNFTVGENLTAVQIIVRDDNVLSKQSLIRQLRLQRSLEANDTINGTLSNRSTIGVATVVSAAAARMEHARELKANARRLKHEKTDLKRRARKLRQQAGALNESRDRLRQRKTRLRRKGERLKQRGQSLREQARKLNESRRELKRDARALERRAQKLNESRRQLERELGSFDDGIKTERKQSGRTRSDPDEQSSLATEAEAIERRAKTLQQRREKLAQRERRLDERARQLERDRNALEEQRPQRTGSRDQDDDIGLFDLIPFVDVADSDERRYDERRDDGGERVPTVDRSSLERRAEQLRADRKELARDKKALNESIRKLNQRREELKQHRREQKQHDRQQQSREPEQSRPVERDRTDPDVDIFRSTGRWGIGRLLAPIQTLQTLGSVQARALQLQQKRLELKAEKRTLEQRAKKLERKGKRLQAKKRTLERRARKLNAEKRELKRRAKTLRQRGWAIKNESKALKANKRALKRKVEQLKDERDELQSVDRRMSITEQIEVLQSRNRSEIRTAVKAVLGGNYTQERSGAFAFMPEGYDPKSTSANATMILITQQANSTVTGATASDRIVNSQLAAKKIVHEQYKPSTAVVFGEGIVTDDIQRLMTDSLSIVGPLALLFVFVVLVLAYRDLLDILLGMAGIVVVLVWTFGFMGWTKIKFNLIFIAVPVLLIGLSIDYAIHVFMRHREERERIKGVGAAMRSGLAAIAGALSLAALTAAIGFLSNLTSSVPPIREFGVVSAVGIIAALLVFGLFIPALKVELDGVLEARGFDRRKRAVGTSGGVVASLLDTSTMAARQVPHVVLIIALVLTAAGGVGATNVDTSFSQKNFLADDPPGWMDHLPEPFDPGEYTAKQSLLAVTDRFSRADSNVEFLIRGNVTDPNTLTAIERAERNASAKNVTATLPSGEGDIESPLSVMTTVAARNESFNQTVTNADTDGDGVPDRNLETVYDSLYTVAPKSASSVIHRTDDGRYGALRMTVSTTGETTDRAVTEQMRAVADSIDATDHLDATATGQPVVFTIVRDQLLRTVIESLLLTLGVTFLFLLFVYRYLYGSASLGVVTLLPVVFSVSWILGTMAVLDIPFNVVTGLITSLTIGLGVDYSIHLSERYSLELEGGTTAWQALETAVSGTGGALLGSAVTTAGGFGVLSFAILPPLRQFGIITGLTILYAFLASVVVLPSFLVLWTRWLGPSNAFKLTRTPFVWDGEEMPLDDD